MNWDQIAGQWKQIKARAQQHWGKLTDDDLEVIAGKREDLIGKLQQRYGEEHSEVERQVDDWSQKLS